MTTTTNMGDSNIESRARNELERRRAQLRPLAVPYAVAGACCVFIGAACVTEFYSAGVGFHAAFPQKSDGTSFADQIMSLRYPIIFCLLAGDVLLQAAPSQASAILNRVIHGIGLGAILMLMVGIGGFIFCAVFLTLGSGDGQGFASHIVGLALGIASAAMFSLSFLGSHTLMGRLFAVVPVIAAGRAERAKIAAGDAVIRDLETHRARVENCRSAVSDMEKPDTLRRRAANEAGTITGMVMAELHDVCASRAAMGDAEVEPQDESEVPDVPLAVLEARAADVERYTADHFLNVLKQKEA
jgi:hypothetical protein